MAESKPVNRFPAICPPPWIKYRTDFLVFVDDFDWKIERTVELLSRPFTAGMLYST